MQADKKKEEKVKGEHTDKLKAIAEEESKAKLMSSKTKLNKL